MISHLRRRPIKMAPADANRIKTQVDGSGTGSRESDSGPPGIGLMVNRRPGGYGQAFHGDGISGKRRGSRAVAHDQCAA